MKIPAVHAGQLAYRAACKIISLNVEKYFPSHKIASTYSVKMQTIAEPISLIRSNDPLVRQGTYSDWVEPNAT